MLLDVVIEKRFFACAKGVIWTDNAFPYAFWERYLTQFSHVNIVARIHFVNEPQKEWNEVLGPKVSFTPLPGYVGLLPFVKSLPATLKQLLHRKGQADRVIYRIPGVLSWLYHIIAWKRNKPYGVEVVGDPSDTFSSGASANPLRPLIRQVFIAMLRKQCRYASSLGYVTQFALQKRYPPNPAGFSTHYSSIFLQNIDYKEVSAAQPIQSQSILCIGNLEQPYKGCDTMLNALFVLKKQGVTAHLTWVGGGQLQSQMESLSRELNVEEQVTFCGNLANRKDIRQLIDNTRLFVLASRQEGLPRVLIEAMARSKVCVATEVGGVGELLPMEWIVAKDDPEQLASSIERALSLSDEQYQKHSKANFIKAREYHNIALSERRNKMYERLRAVK